MLVKGCGWFMLMRSELSGCWPVGYMWQVSLTRLDPSTDAARLLLNSPAYLKFSFDKNITLLDAQYYFHYYLFFKYNL